MSDYIKREDAISRIKTWIEFDELDKRGLLDGISAALTAIDSMPTDDIAERRHGKWREYGKNNDNTHNIGCSICGHKIKSKGHANSVYTKRKYRYCPYCGARMDGEEQEQ